MITHSAFWTAKQKICFVSRFLCDTPKLQWTNKSWTKKKRERLWKKQQTRNYSYVNVITLNKYSKHARMPRGRICITHIIFCVRLLCVWCVRQIVCINFACIRCQQHQNAIAMQFSPAQSAFYALSLSLSRYELWSSSCIGTTRFAFRWTHALYIL